MSVGIYIHIPFCVSKCNYCDFNSHTFTSGERESYVEALCREIELYSGDLSADTVYFGGGTPTVLRTDDLIRILSSVRNKFLLSDLCEITFECNPKTIDYEGFALLKSAGFNRLSVGVQSTDDEQLKILGRIHTAEDCEKCIYEAKRAGFDNISADLMYGIPNQNLKSLDKTLNVIREYKIQHISAYTLKIEEGTPFSHMRLNIVNDDECADMYEYIVKFLKSEGFNRYEISNFSKPGYESGHNLKYWNCDDYIGFGAGAHSLISGERFSNIKNSDEYIEKINAEKSVIDNKRVLSDFEKMSEFVFLGLRLSGGVSVSEFKKRFSFDIYDIFKTQLDRNIRRGTIIKKNDRLIIPDKFVFVSNAIMSEFV